MALLSSYASDAAECSVCCTDKTADLTHPRRNLSFEVKPPNLQNTSSPIPLPPLEITTDCCRAWHLPSSPKAPGGAPVQQHSILVDRNFDSVVSQPKLPQSLLRNTALPRWIKLKIKQQSTTLDRGRQSNSGNNISSSIEVNSNKNQKRKEREQQWRERQQKRRIRIRQE